jgi:HEAT repeat protein
MRFVLHASMLLIPLAAAAQVASPPARPAPPAPAMAPLAPSSPLDGQWLRFGELESRYATTIGDASLAYARALDLEASAHALAMNFGDRYAPSALFLGDAGALPSTPRAAWAPNDPADSLYRVAREHLNRGDYRRAASLFGDISKRYPTSVYARDVPYWHAFSLYRLGGTPELQEALGILERYRAQASQLASERALAPRAPASGLTPRDAVLSTGTSNVTMLSLGGRPDGDALAARIAGVLSSRGMTNDPAVRRALTARGGDACDQEEQSVRSEALQALMRSDPESARAAAGRMLARKDDCSVPLRRTALFLLAERKDAAAMTTVVGVARNDPSNSLRIQAIDWLAQMPSDEAVTVLEQLTRDADASVQRVAARALARHPNPRARPAVRSFVERTDTDESLRMAMIDGFTAERTSVEDLAWLRGLYGRTTSTRLQGRIAASVARFGGEENMQWLTALARNEEEPIDSRLAAMRAISSTADLATLSRLYDGATHQRVRGVLIDALAQRKDPGALDKLIEIAKNGTDPSARRAAISALSQSKDPRATKLLLDLVDR